MFSFEGSDEFIKGIDKWLNDRNIEAVEVFRGVAVNAFFEVLEHTPQWTGNAAANWNFGVGELDSSVNYEYTGDFEEAQAVSLSPKNPSSEFINERGSARHKAGDPEAIAFSIGRARGKPGQVRLTQIVYLSNSAESITGKSYIMMLENNQNNFLRPENNPGHMVAEAVKKLGNNKVLSDANKKEYRYLGKLI